MRHTLSAALSLERCSRRTTDSQGAEGVVRAGLEVKGQKVLKQDIRVEQKVSVALLASRYDNCVRGGSEDETIADSREGESERKLRRKVTCGGVFDVSGIMLRLRVRRKWSEVENAHTLGAVGSRHRIPGSSWGFGACSRVSPQSWTITAGAEIRTHNLGLQVRRSIH